MAYKGDIIKVSLVRKINILPDHYGIYDGENGVYHFTGNSFEDARIMFTSLDEFENGGISYIENVYAEKFSPEEIIQRAASKLGSDFGKYHLTKNNCEHFAYWCVTGIRKSQQTLNINSEDDNRDVVERAIDVTFDPLINAGRAVDRFFGWDDKVRGEKKDIVEKTIDRVFDPLIKMGGIIDRIFKL